MSITLAIEGNIGAGKSTLITMLKNHYGDNKIEFIGEPVELWKNCNGENLLGAFYSDPTKYAYLLQTIVMVSTCIEHTKEQTKAIRITERSTASNMCFASNCADNGLMDAKEYAAYKYWCSYLASMSKKPTCYIYLRTSPEVCFARMNSRNRKEESGVSMDYLQQLHDKHDEWFNSTNDNYITISGDTDFENDQLYLSQMIESIDNMITRE